MASLPQTQLQDGMPEVTSSRNHGAGAPLTQELQVMQSLAESSEGAVLRRYIARLVDAITDTRNITHPNKEVGVEAANVASAILEENLIAPLSRVHTPRAEFDSME